MPRLGLLVATLVAALLATPAPAPAASDAVPGEIIVRFKGNAGGSDRAAARRSARVALERSMRLSGTQLVRTEPGQETAGALAALRRDPRVRHAIPNGIYRKSATTPNDSHFTSLWGLHNDGSIVNGDDGAIDADVDGPEAWDLFHSAPHTVVAVVDTGVRMDHPDLRNNLWTDEDGSHGWDFVDGDDDPTDLDSHGTHVAGTIAAEGDNGRGITGVAWDAQIMPVRVLDENGSGDGQAIVDGLVYAAERGARVVNASLGGGTDNPAATKAFYDALFNDYPDTLFVVAAGNDSSDNDATPVFPCNSTAPNVICVAATTNTDSLAADFSNFGKTTVDLAAPGQGIRSTIPTVAAVGTPHDFNTGLPAGWNTTGSTGGGWKTYLPFSGYPFGDWAGEAPANGDFSFSRNERLRLTSAAYDLSGRDACVTEYDLYHDFDAGKDRLLVESSRDNGSTWSPRAEYTGTSEGIEKVVTNLNADGAPSARLRFHTQADGTTGGQTDWFGSLIDNVGVRCAVKDGESYVFFRGTSMAAPHVAGVAALLFGARSDADVADVRGWLLSTGDPLQPLDAAKVATGRRLNAEKALLAAGLGAPVITRPGGVVDVQPTGATLLGTVKAGGSETTYRFEYGRPGALDTATADASAGAGTGSVVVSAPITGLSAETAYEYRLVTVRDGTETQGAVRSFTTRGKLPPVLTLDPATGVGSTVATIGGTVDPKGRSTTALLEFGRTSGSYTGSTDELTVRAPSRVSTELTGLTPGTRYFYRLRAENADGESVSPELSFTTTGTQAPPSPTTPVPGVIAQTPPPPTTGPPPAPPRVSVACRLSKRKKVTCKARTTATLKVNVLVMRGTRVFARGSAARLVKGRALKMKTVRRTRRGRYTLRITVSQNGAIVTTLKKSIRL